MNEKEKHFYVFNVTEGMPLFRKPLSRLEAHGLIRFFRQVFDLKGVYVTEQGKRIRPEEVVLELIDAESEAGRRIAEEQARHA